MEEASDLTRFTRPAHKYSGGKTDDCRFGSYGIRAFSLSRGYGVIGVYDRRDERMVRCEAARVYLPGFAYAEVYATPFYNNAGEFVEGRWSITEVRSGWKICDGATIEKAVDEAAAILKRLRMTRERFDAAVEKAIAERLREVAMGRENHVGVEAK